MTAGPPATTLADLLEDPAATAGSIEQLLDGLDPEARVAQCQALGGRAQARLWELAADGGPLTIDDIVPPAVPPGQTVIFAGRNSMPTFSLFEKRFARVGTAVIGYNHQSMGFVTGPGYFTVVPSPSSPRELLFDYTQIPDAAPEGWPPVRSNQVGLSRFVYKNLHDYMRRVSRDVVIGYATRLGKPINSYFVLARR